MKTKLEMIHDHALRILSEIGVEMYHGDILDLLRDHGVTVAGQTAQFTPGQIMDWVGCAPETFTLHARNPHHDIVIGGDRVNFAPGYGCASVCDADGNRREAVLSDYLRFVKLVHQCDHFDINGGILVQPADIPAEHSHLLMLYAALIHSDKCLMGIPGNEAEMQDIMDLCAIAYGGRSTFTARPHILTMVSTISPLRIDKTALAAIKTAATHNQPLIISPAPAAGTTGPIDLAGNLALATAEALAVIAVTQMIRPGTPVIFGLQCYGADLRTGDISVGSPAYALQAKYTASLARMYGLPSRCGGSVSDDRRLSAKCGYESMLSLLTAAQNGVNLMVHSAGILNRFAAMSYEKLVMDMEMIRMVKYYLNDIDIDSRALNLNLVKTVGPGGQFLTSMDTVRKCRTHSWQPAYRNPSELDIKDIRGKRTVFPEDDGPPAMTAETRHRLEHLLLDRGVSAPLIDRISSDA